MPAGVKDRTSEFLREVELSDIRQDDLKKSKPKSSSPKASKKRQGSEGDDKSGSKAKKGSLKHLKQKLLHKDGNANAIPDEATVAAESDLSHFLTLIATTRQIIETIRSDGKQINAKSLDLINSVFKDERRKQEAEALIGKLRQNSKLVHKNLQELKELIRREEARLPPAALAAGAAIPNELRIRRTQYFVMVNDFRETLNTFNIESADSRSKYLSIIQNRLSITGSSRSAEEVEDLIEKGDWSIFTDGLLLDTQHAKDQLDQLESRRKFILELETAVTELHEMFITLGTLVEAQGETIDRIESQVKGTHDYIQQAESQLSAARKSKKRARRCKIILAAAGTVAVVIVLVVVFA